MKNIKKYMFPLLPFGVYPILEFLYHWLNKRPVPLTDTTFFLDYWIPFVPAFIIPYFLWFPFTYLCLLYFLIKDRPLYYRVILTDTVGRLICYIIYFLFPTTIPRPTIDATNLLLRMVDYLYKTDYPTNCFPSIHCFNTILLMLALYSSTFQHTKNKLLIYPMGWLIILSTLFLKQHSFADVLASFILVIPLHLLMIKTIPYKIPLPNKSLQSERSF